MIKKARIVLTACMALTLCTGTAAAELQIAQSTELTPETSEIKPYPAEFHGLIDIGGYSLFANLTGERREGRPVLVFENGYGDSAEIWNAVVPQLSSYTRILTYDRANIGSSDAPAEDHYTAADAAHRLNELLRSAGVNGPVVLVGHSIGGLYIREFTRLYGSRVKGLVFVDSSMEHMEDALFPELTTEERQALMEADIASSGGSEGTYDPHLLQTYQQLDAGSSADVLRQLPITVLTSGNHEFPPIFPHTEARWAMLQSTLASLSDDAVHITDSQHGHYLHAENPQLVIDAVVEMLDRASE